MTISRLAIILFRCFLFPVILYWILKLFVLNHGLNTWYILSTTDPIFVWSFIFFLVTIGVYVIFFVLYLVANKNRSVVIVLNPLYIKDNFWKDLRSL